MIDDPLTVRARSRHADVLVAFVWARVPGAEQLLPANPARTQRLLNGWATLTNATNNYLFNIRNAKITNPLDDNFRLSWPQLPMLPPPPSLSLSTPAVWSLWCACALLWIGEQR